MRLRGPRYATDEFQCPITKRWERSGFTGDLNGALISDHHTSIDGHWHTLDLVDGAWVVTTCTDHGRMEGPIEHHMANSLTEVTCINCGGPADRLVRDEIFYQNAKVVVKDSRASGMVWRDASGEADPPPDPGVGDIWESGLEPKRIWTGTDWEVLNEEAI